MKKSFLLAILVAIFMVTLSFGQDESASEITTTVASTIIPPSSIPVKADIPKTITPTQQRPTIIGAIKNFKINILHAMADKINRIPNIF